MWGMTMPVVTPHRTEGWTIDGALVTAPPAISHRRASHRLETVLRKACPPHLAVLAVGLGVECGDGRTYVPDLMVTRTEAMEGEGDVVHAADVLMVVEVMSLSNPLPGLVLRRHDYGAAGIAQYWIFDSRSQTLTVHSDPSAGADGYRTAVTVDAGAVFSTVDPFVVEVDPGLIR